MNTWAASGAAGSRLSVTSSPSFFAVRGTAVGGSDACASTASSSSRPTPIFVETQTIGVSVPCRTASAHSRCSSSFDGISPSRYFSITASSASMIDSNTDSLSFGRIDQRAGRVLGQVERADDALQIVPLADRHVEQRALRAEHFFDRIDEVREVDVVGIELGDAQDAAQARVARFLPHAARVHLDAGVGVDRDDRRFDRPQCADRLADEIRVAGRVDHVESLAGVIEVDDRGFDRVLVMLFLFVEVADAGAVIDAGLAGDRARLHEQVIDERRLARRAVSADGNVANVVDVLGHDYSVQLSIALRSMFYLTRQRPAAHPRSVNVPSYKCPADDAAGQTRGGQPCDVVDRRDAARGDHRHIDRRLHLGHRRRRSGPASMPSVAMSV